MQRRQKLRSVLVSNFGTVVAIWIGVSRFCRPQSSTGTYFIDPEKVEGIVDPVGFKPRR